MADLTISTPGSVVKYSNAKTAWGTAGTTITAGQSLYLDANTNLLMPAIDTSAAAAAAVGIALNGGSVNQPIQYITSGGVNLGATLTLGVTYVVGAGAGGISPIADIGTGEYPTILGIAITTSRLEVNINRSGIAAA